ncbi:MAG: endonuclease/exonuclease/phosphatase family protein [Saccharospirillum sp.]|nr:endonuclease/exonuclease/phosphatase family protein [Saccharospirillum sp.]
MRLVTYNVALNRPEVGQLARELAGELSPQLSAVLTVLGGLQADVLVLNEVDYDPQHLSFNALRQCLAARGCHYPYGFTAPVNTGVLSGRDLVKPGGTKNTPFGFGAFAGQYGMAVFSRWPINTDKVRTFQTLLWRDMPDALLPHWPDGRAFYSEADLAILRLSSKSHWDLPIQIGRTTLHLLVSHPTPPAFDGPEGRNRWHNAAEIDFWTHYIEGQWSVKDDQGRAEPFIPAPFVIAGDLNADPDKGDSLDAINRLLSSPQLQDPTPISEGARERWPDQPFCESNTAVWGLRADYLLPSSDLEVVNSEVIWPMQYHKLAKQLSQASDHRPVVLDIEDLYP